VSTERRVGRTSRLRPAGIIVTRIRPPPAVHTARATVLFADLRGYTGMAERLPAVSIVPLLDEFFLILATATETHGGKVYHMAGDGMMAGFGVVDADGGARAALAAGHAMLRGFAVVAARWRSELSIEAGIGVGLHLGEVAVGVLGPPGHRATTLVGDTVNVAARLCSRARAGDPDAFRLLVERHSQPIFRVAYRMTGNEHDADDVVQEAFLRAYRQIDSFEERANFGTWLHRIAVHTVLARRRGLRVEYEVAEPATGLPEVADPGSEAPPLDLERAIAALPDGARHVLVLVGLYGFSHAEAAHTLGIAEGTCKAQLHRARGLLAAALGLEMS